MQNYIERDIFVLRDASSVAQPIEYVQGTNAVPILLHLRDYAIPEGSTVRVYVEWPSTKGEYDESGITVDGNNIIIEPKDTLFSEVGKSYLHICILNGEDTLVTFAYPVMVKKNPVPGITEPSKNKSDFLDEYLADIEAKMEETVIHAENTAQLEANTLQYSQNASASAEAALQSQTKALEYANASSDSADEAKTSEANALTYKNAASTSAQIAETSNQSAKQYAEASAESAKQASQSETNALSYSQTAKEYADQINDRIDEATASAQSAKESSQTASSKAAEATESADIATNKATEAQTSASNASDSAIAATDKAAEALASAENAEESATLASDKAAAASTSEANAKTYANTATTKASEASTSATTAKTKATEASNSATAAASSATEAKASEEAAVEYKEGAEYYYNQAKLISESFSGSLRPMGTVTFANLPALSEVTEGDMYNVSDQFTTTASYKEGSGIVVPAGSNVYKTADEYWDVLAGSPVTGVKGNAESVYRKGNVNITPANIGLGNLINEKQYCASNPQPSVEGSSGSCTGNSATATLAETATNVSGAEGTADSDRHVWFSHSSTETKRAYDDDFKYNPVDNELKVGKISGSAATLTNARTIDGVDFDGSAAISHYGTCSTAAATAAKTVALSGFKLVTGARVMVKFTVTNTASSPTLNVNSTGAKGIMYRGSAITAGYLAANRVYEFVYDGTDWELVGDINTDTNTKNTAGSTNSTSKLFVIGAGTQAANPQTYSNSDVYMQDGKLYSGGEQTQTITGDTADNKTTFTSGDSTSPTAWTDVTAIATGEKHSSLFNKLSTFAKNVRWLYKMLGTTDISAIGDGTCTGAINTINNNLAKCEEDFSGLNSNLKKYYIVSTTAQNLTNYAQYINTFDNDGALYGDYFTPEKSGFKCLKDCMVRITHQTFYRESNVGVLQTGYRLYTSFDEYEDRLVQFYNAVANKSQVVAYSEICSVKAGQYIRPTVNGVDALGVCTTFKLYMEVI